MSFGVGYINVQLLYQNLLKFDMPFVYDAYRSMLIPNPKLKKRWKMPLWEIVNFLVITTFVYCAIYEIRVFHAAEKASKINPELFIVHGFIIVICTQQLVTLYTFERDPSGVTYMVSSAFQLLRIKHVGLPTPDRLPDIPEIFCYNVAIGFFIFPFLLAFFPFVRSYDPINTMLENSISFKLVRNALAASLYCFITFYSSTSCSSYILLAMSTTHAFESLSGKMLKLTMSVDGTAWRSRTDNGEDSVLEIVFWKKLIKNMTHKAIKMLARFFPTPEGKVIETGTLPRTARVGEQRKSEGVIDNFSLYLNEFTNSRLMNEEDPSGSGADKQLRPRYRGIVKTFREVYKLHCQTHILITVSNKSVEAFVPVMTSVGMSICIVVNFTIIKVLNFANMLVNDIQNGRVEFTKHVQEVIIISYCGIVVGLALVAVMIGLIIFFCKHATQPILHSEKYIHMWRHSLQLPRLERRQARAMSNIAFYLGPFFKPREDMALRISHKVLDFTITLLLGLS